MTRFKGLIIGGILLLCVGVCAIHITQQQIAHKAVDYISAQEKYLLPRFVKWDYTDLKTDKCLFSACLSAQNVQFRLPGNEPDKPFVFDLGKVSLRRNMFGYYSLSADGIMSAHTDSASSISVAFDASGTLSGGTLHQFQARQNQFEATLSGKIDKEKQLIDLHGTSIRLATFAKQFFPADMYFIADLLLDDDTQSISVTTDEEWVRILDFPVIRKQQLFP